MQGEPYKRCPRCKRSLPVRAFSPNPRLRFGVNCWCRDCCNAQATQCRHRKAEERASLRAAEAVQRAEEARCNAVAWAAAIPPDFGHWLAGFVDGEACFDLSRRPDYNAQARYTPRFVLILRADDRAVLDRIQHVTGLGITHEKKAPPGGRGRLQYGWFVTRKADVVALAALFDRFPLRSKKARDFAIWREAAYLYGLTPYRYRHNARGREAYDCWERLGELTAELIAVRRFS